MPRTSPRRLMQVSDSVIVDAEADTLWAQLADPTQMPRWSPENTGASSPGRPLEVGESFDVTNRRGRARWITRCVVTESEPGRRFAFRVQRIGVRTPRLRGGIATWTYELSPQPDGSTEVTETWRDDRTSWPDALARIFDRRVTGGRLMSEFQRGNIRRTLTRMREEFATP